jgi:N-hydroxyarylamine O-acetyltransferase
VLYRLLRHIGLDAVPAADLEGLHAVHRAYLERVPYEDLAIQLGETGPLDERALAARVVSGRGGYCFELNTVLAMLLRELGFNVSYHEGVVGGEGPTNHMVLLVDLDGERWIADAGLGEAFIDPLPLREGRHHGRGPFSWTLEREPSMSPAGAGTSPSGRFFPATRARTASRCKWWIAQHEWGSFDGVRVDEARVERAAFEPHHRRLGTDPGSPFARTLVVQRPTDDRILTLRSRTYSEKGPDVDTSRVVDREEFGHLLRERFGIALDRGRRERLWELAAAQHDAFLVRA